MANIENHSILLIEDELSLATIVKETLESKGLNVAVALTISQANRLIKDTSFDLFLVDVMLPDGDGFDFVNSLRQDAILSPIIFLTSRTLPNDVVKGFEIGANDYIKKPFSLAELFVRIQHQLQITPLQKNETKKQDFTIGIFHFSYPAGLLISPTSRKQLTSREADILHLLITSPFDISRKYILDQIWKEDDYFAGRSLDVFITKLRKYLSEDSSVALINVRGKGYRLVC